MKKNLNKLKLALMLMLLSAFQLSAQTATAVSGKITDAVTNEPLMGVTIQLKGTSTGTITDMDGLYSLSIPTTGAANGILVYAYLGYQSQEVKIDDKTTINLSLRENIEALDELVVVGYGVQKRVNMTGSVSSMKSSEVKTLPVANISNSIGGRVSGLVTQQASGEPGNDKSTLYLRGNKNPLVLVDGIESEFNKVNMEEVESITLLKDASAVAPYGLKGANGVVLITTKRGQTGKLSVSYNGEFGWQKPTNTPEFMNSVDGMRLKKKALEMDGQQAETDNITEELLAAYALGTDAYPNTDWVKNYMGTSNNQRHTVTINGGNEMVRAYMTMGYLNQGSMFGAGQDYNRYNLRSNLDFKLSKTTSFSADIALISDEKKSNSASANETMVDIYRAKSTEADIYSNGLPAFQSTLGKSIHQVVNGAGSKSDINSYQQLTLTFNQELPFVPGLSFKALFNINHQAYNGKNWKEPYIYYTYDEPTDTYTESKIQATHELTLNNRVNNYKTVQGYINYGNSFGKHDISGLLVYERRWGGQKTNFSAKRTDYVIEIPELEHGNEDKQTNTGTSSAEAQDGIVFRANYSYDQRYLFEVAGRYDRTYQYAPGKRSAVFPSASVGWRISEESFFNIPAVNNLKLRVSYGKSGNPVGRPFQWSPTYTTKNDNNTAVPGYIWGTEQKPEKGLQEYVEPNPNLTWETVWKSNAGFDLNMWNGLFGLEFDVFREHRADMLITPSGDYPAEYGISPAQMNARKEERYGIDFTVLNSTRVGKDLVINNSFVFGFARDRQLDLKEAPGNYSIPQFRRTGLSYTHFRGYVAEGLFADEEDVMNWAYQTSNTQPGDVKYKDINGDGKIDASDEVVIGKSRVPEIMYGYTLGIDYKNFDLRLFLQGTGNSDFYMGQDASGGSDRGVRRPFENDKPREDHKNSWTVDNPDPNAKYPRLSVNTNKEKNHMNYAPSTFWLVNTSYLKLKSLELGYNFDPRLTRKIYMQQARLYVNFYNLWTIYSKMPRDFDVENQNYNVYPQQFITSVGLNITF